MSNITFPKAKVGDKIRLTGTQWDKDENGVQAGDIVTVTDVSSEECGIDFKLAPKFEDTVHGGYLVIYTDSDDPECGDWGGELVADTEPTFEAQVRRITGGIADLLIEKNRKYGNSALDPERIFSGASSTEAIRVRSDDKLSRIKTSDPDDQEDSITDLIGYLTILLIAEGRHE